MIAPAKLKGVIMAELSLLNPHPRDFERFLYAPVGEDRRGYNVTVLSMMARLGLDPWDETAELVTIGRQAAQTRLRKLLQRFWDVPALSSDSRKVANDLSRLLPERAPILSLTQSGSDIGAPKEATKGVSWVVLVVILVVLQLLMIGGLGLGE